MGRGRSVIGGTLHDAADAGRRAQRRSSTASSRWCRATPSRARGARAGLHEMGLPYVSDPAITRHLAAFPASSMLDGADDAARRDPLQRRRLPAGSRCASASSMCCSSGSTAGQPWQPLVLTNPSLDLAVAWGAAHFAWLQAHRRQAHRRRHRAVVLPRRRASGAASGETRPHASVLCVVPQHLEEGEEIALPKPELELALGQPVLFPLYTSTVRGDDKPGDVLRRRAGATAATAAAAHRPARRQTQRHQAACRSRWRPAAPRSARWNCSASPRKATTAGGWSSTSATSSRTTATPVRRSAEQTTRHRRLARGAGAGGGRR